MMYAAIMSMDVDGRVTKYQAFSTLAQAQAFVAARLARYPGAIAIEAPAAQVPDWKVADGTAVVDPDPDRLAREQADRAREDARTAALTALETRGSGSVTRAEFEELKATVRALV